MHRIVRTLSTGAGCSMVLLASRSVLNHRSQLAIETRNIHTTPALALSEAGNLIIFYICMGSVQFFQDTINDDRKYIYHSRYWSDAVGPVHDITGDEMFLRCLMYFFGSTLAIRRRQVHPVRVIAGVHNPHVEVASHTQSAGLCINLHVYMNAPCLYASACMRLVSL
jgi:hypothetical protein